MQILLSRTQGQAHQVSKNRNKLLATMYHLFSRSLYRAPLIGGPRFGEFCSCSCLPLLPQLASSIHATWGPPFSGALYSSMAAAANDEPKKKQVRFLPLASSIMRRPVSSVGARTQGVIWYLLATSYSYDGKSSNES